MRYQTVCVILGVLTAVASAGTIHVAKEGSDAAPCSVLQPCLTVQHGLDTALSGDTVLIGDGDFVVQELSLGTKDLTVRSASGDARRTRLICDTSSFCNPSTEECQELLQAGWILNAMQTSATRFEQFTMRKCTLAFDMTDSSAVLDSLILETSGAHCTRGSPTVRNCLVRPQLQITDSIPQSWSSLHFEDPTLAVVENVTIQCEAHEATGIHFDTAGQFHVNSATISGCRLGISASHGSLVAEDVVVTGNRIGMNLNSLTSTVLRRVQVIRNTFRHVGNNNGFSGLRHTGLLLAATTIDGLLVHSNYNEVSNDNANISQFGSMTGGLNLQCPHCTAPGSCKAIPNSGDPECFTPCSAGSGRIKWGEPGCQACGPGEYSNPSVTLVDDCQPCPRGTFPDTLQTYCKPCPPGMTTSGEGAPDATECVLCDKGEYAEDSLPGECKLCPRNMTTSGPGSIGAASCNITRPPEILCGNGVLDGDEQCDLGAGLNSDDGACRLDCRQPSCGNGLLDFDEECDPADSRQQPCSSSCIKLTDDDDGDSDTAPATPGLPLSVGIGLSVGAVAAAFVIGVAGTRAVAARERDMNKRKEQNTAQALKRNRELEATVEQMKKEADVMQQQKKADDREIERHLKDKEGLQKHHERVMTELAKQPLANQSGHFKVNDAMFVVAPSFPEEDAETVDEVVRVLFVTTVEVERRMLTNQFESGKWYTLDTTGSKYVDSIKLLVGRVKRNPPVKSKSRSVCAALLDIEYNAEQHVKMGYEVVRELVPRAIACLRNPNQVRYVIMTGMCAAISQYHPGMVLVSSKVCSWTLEHKEDGHWKIEPGKEMFAKTPGPMIDGGALAIHNCSWKFGDEFKTLPQVVRTGLISVKEVLNNSEKKRKLNERLAEHPEWKDYCGLEMEGAGLAAGVAHAVEDKGLSKRCIWLVIKGVADTGEEKTKLDQGYAAAAAAAFAIDLVACDTRTRSVSK